MNSSERLTVDVEGRVLQLSNVDKVLYPSDGFTKGQVIDYYARVAPVLLPHLADRPLTVKRYPNGVGAPSFFEKNAPSHTPDWIRRVELASPGSTKDRDTIRYLLLDDLPGLVWAANLASLELHIPQWTVGPRGGVRGADLMVFDLDPGEPATICECAQVAEMIRAALAEDGLTAYPKTSGSKGMQLYVPVRAVDSGRTWDYARALAQRLSEQRPALVVWKMTKALRGGKVLIDWSQNAAAKTTVAPYSLRARPHPTVSTPVTWDEVQACAAGAGLSFTSDEVLDRIERLGDLAAALRTDRQELPGGSGQQSQADRLGHGA